MDISAIIKSIFEAKKIGAMTIAALALSLLAYLYSEKIGIVQSEDKVGALLVLFTITFVFLVVMVFLYGIATTKMRYEHLDSMKEKDSQQKSENPQKTNPSKSIKSLSMNNQALKNLVHQQNFVALFEKLDLLYKGDNADYQYSNIRQNILHEINQNRSPTPTQIQGILIFLNSEKLLERLGNEENESTTKTDNATYNKSNVIKGDNNGTINNQF